MGAKVSFPVVAIVGLVYTYKSTGASELRTEVYTPLFSDLIRAEQSVQAVSTERPPGMTALEGMKRNGTLVRIPARIRGPLVAMAEEVNQFHTSIHPVRDRVRREMSSQLMQLRTEEADRAWQAETERALQEIAFSQQGIIDSLTVEASHEGRSRLVDIRDPTRMTFAGPGGPTFVVRDWVLYPESLRQIDELWTSLDYLYFSETSDEWYYRLTCADLERVGISLQDFLSRTHSALLTMREYQYLASNRQSLLDQLAHIKTLIQDRIADPKQLVDLVRK